VKIVDANVLLYAVNAESVHHDGSRTWLDSALSGRESIGFAWTVILAFVRISTSPTIFDRPLSAAQAVATAEDWLAQPPAVVVEPTTRHLALLGGLLATSGTAGNLVSDAHLATLALEHNAEIVTYDTDFARFNGLRWSAPTKHGT
jgi:uncharacterized protein